MTSCEGYGNIPFFVAHGWISYAVFCLKKKRSLSISDFVSSIEEVLKMKMTRQPLSSPELSPPCSLVRPLPRWSRPASQHPPPPHLPLCRRAQAHPSDVHSHCLGLHRKLLQHRRDRLGPRRQKPPHRFSLLSCSK